MKRTSTRSAAVAGVLVAAVALLSPGAAQAGTGSTTSSTASTSRNGLTPTTLPVLVDPAAALTAVADRPSESWYVIAHVTAGGHRYGFLAHYLSSGTGSAGVVGSAVSVTDETTGWYTQSSITLPGRTGLSGAPGIDIHTSNITWTGDLTRMTLHARVPQGHVDVTLRPRGHVLYNAGTGCFAMFGDPRYANVEYSIPTVDTSGSLTLAGRTQPLRGEAWFDRQWGPLPDLRGGRASWTWMDLNLSDGDKVSLWDQRAATRNAFATILSPDGTHTVATAATAYDPSTLWASPASGNRYATRWTVTIPSRHARLTVTVTAKDQELMAPVPRYEGSATVTGTYGGHAVHGYTYVEAFGVG